MIKELKQLRTTKLTAGRAGIFFFGLGFGFGFGFLFLSSSESGSKTGSSLSSVSSSEGESSTDSAAFFALACKAENKRTFRKALHTK